MDWLYLALLTPLLWSFVVLIDDNMLQHVYKGPFMGALISGLFGALPLISLIWKDLSSHEFTVGLTGMTAGFLTVVYYYYYFKALERESPSIVIALFSLTPVTLPFLAYFFLGESLTSQQILGFGVVIAGSFLLAATDIRRFKFSKAIVSILIAAFIYDVVSLATKYTYENTDFYTGYMYFAAGMGLGGLLYLYQLLFLRKGKMVKEVLRRNSKLILLLLAGAEGINIAAEFLQNLAISRGPVSLVKAVENVQPIYMLVLAILFYPVSPRFFREASEGKAAFKLIMMSVIIIGVAVTVTG